MLATYRILEKTEYKAKKGNADLHFLRTCQENGLIPKFLYFRLHNPRLKTSEMYRNFQKKLLSYEISVKEKQVDSLQKQAKVLHSQLKNSVNGIDYNHFKELIERSTTTKVTGDKATHMKKLHKLGYTAFEELPPDKVLFNVSSRVLSPTEESVLSKGLKFALPPKRLSLERYLYTFEKLYESLQKYPIWQSENNQFESFKDKLKHLALSSFQRFKKHEPPPIFSKEEMEALKSLSRDKSIVITRPDKGNGVVLMDKQDYISKVNSVLQDTTKFEKIVGLDENEPLKVVFRLEDKINRFLKNVIGNVDSNGKRDATYDKLYVSGSNLGILYGLPKVHKEGFPIRPILSACNTPGYGLGKYLVPIISPITTNDL